MKTFARLAAGLCICAIASQANAWSQPTHKNIVKDALAFMNSSYATEEMRQAYRFYVSAAGSEAQAGEILGQAAFDVDDFKDTRLGGWWVGYEHAPLWGAASGIVNYTSYWHFLNLARDGDSHGNPHGGYDYRYHKVDGGIADVDWYAMVYLYNRELKREDFDTTEAHYRQGTRSDWQEHYGDFQTAAFQPIDNLATYWFEQFRAAPSLQTIGYALHATGDVARAATDDLGNHALMTCQHAIALGRSAGNNVAADLLGVEPIPYSQVKYVTCLDLGGWGAVFTEGWDRQVRFVREEGKKIKTEINGVWIYPPAADRAVAQPHHVWITSANGHSSWEGWVDDHYASEKLNDPAAVANLVGRYDPSKSIRDLLTQTGQVAYARPEPLYDTSYETRLRVAKELIPESIALTVTVLTKGANSFDAQTAL